MFNLFAALAIVTLQVFICHGFVAQPKIVDGVVSDRSNFPFFVNVVSQTQDGDKVVTCGGVILNERWVITAAHCLTYRTAVHVYFGVLPRNYYQKVQVVDETNQHVYVGYAPVTKANDIGLIKLPTAVPFGPYIRPVKLPTNCDETSDNAIVIAAGNGRTSNDAPADDTTLRHASLRIISRQECRAAYYGTLPSTTICALSIDQGSVNAGDSGGPLIRQSDGTLVGVTSFIFARPDGVHGQGFANVANFYAWMAYWTGMDLPKCRNQALVYEKIG